MYFGLSGAENRGLCVYFGLSGAENRGKTDLFYPWVGGAALSSFASPEGKPKYTFDLL
jgi:hypothetical protein